MCVCVVVVSFCFVINIYFACIFFGLSNFRLNFAHSRHTQRVERADIYIYISLHPAPIVQNNFAMRSLTLTLFKPNEPGFNFTIDFRFYVLLFFMWRSKHGTVEIVFDDEW